MIGKSIVTSENVINSVLCIRFFWHLWMVFKMLIFIFNYNLWKYLVRHSLHIVTYSLGALLFLDFVESLLLSSIWWYWVLAVHHLKSWIIICSDPININSVRVFIFKCAQATAWSLAQQESWQIRRGNKVIVWFSFINTLLLRVFLVSNWYLFTFWRLELWLCVSNCYILVFYVCLRLRLHCELCTHLTRRLLYPLFILT